jgi:hypothetical protein
MWKSVHKKVLSLLSYSTPLSLLVFLLTAALLALAGSYAFVGALHALSLALGWQWDRVAVGSSVSNGLSHVADTLHLWAGGGAGAYAAYARGGHPIPNGVGVARSTADNLAGIPFLDEQMNPFPIDVVYTWSELI